jgi:hypothetical protein
LRQALLDGVRELLGPPTPETDALERLIEEVTRPCVGIAP